MGPDVSPQNDVCPRVALEIDFAWAPNLFGAEVLDPVRAFFLIRFDPTRSLARAPVNSSPGEITCAEFSISKQQIN